MTLFEMTTESNKAISPYENNVATIRNKLKLIYDFCYKNGIDNGEVRVLICKHYGRRTENIEESLFDEIFLWFKNNHFRKDQILSPELHAACMASNDRRYSEWFLAEEKKHTHEVRERCT